jgi:deoxyribose-phosphate aldolase
MIKAGATRIGASAGIKIMQGPSASKPAAVNAASGKSN